MLQYIIRTKLTWSIILSLFTIILNGNTTLLGAEEGWPRQIKTSSADIIIYQPQPEIFEGNKLTARAAVGVTLKDMKEPVFGAIWIDSRVETDRDARIVTVEDINVNNIRFPDATDEQIAKLKIAGKGNSQMEVGYFTGEFNGYSRCRGERTGRR